jgi:hypothetical protein
MSPGMRQCNSDCGRSYCWVLVLVAVPVSALSVELSLIADGQARFPECPRHQPPGRAASLVTTPRGAARRCRRSRRAVHGSPGGPGVGVSGRDQARPVRPPARPIGCRRLIETAAPVRRIASAPITHAADRCGERSIFFGGMQWALGDLVAVLRQNWETGGRQIALLGRPVPWQWRRRRRWRSRP